MLGAIEKLWPQTDLYLYEWHLQHALRRLPKNNAAPIPSSRRRLTLLIPQVEAGFAGQSFWERFKPKLLVVGLKPIDDWVATKDSILQWQFARRGWRRPPNTPLSTGGLEQLTRPIRDAIHPRRYVLKNRERMNRLLMLMQLHADGLDSHTDCAKTIRDWLLSKDGRPKVGGRRVTDRKGSPSLR
jgi:hypothetical protein